MTEPSKEAVELLAETAWEHSRKMDIELGERPTGEYAKSWDQAAEHLKDEWRVEATGTIAIALPVERKRWEKETRERALSSEVVDPIAKRNIIESLYGHWENFPAKEANQERRYEQLSEDVKESYREPVRTHIAAALDAIFDKGEGDG